MRRVKDAPTTFPRQSWSIGIYSPRIYLSIKSLFQEMWFSWRKNLLEKLKNFQWIYCDWLPKVCQYILIISSSEIKLWHTYAIVLLHISKDDMHQAFRRQDGLAIQKWKVLLFFIDFVACAQQVTLTII